MILYRYIISKHVLPFLYSFSVIVFVMMMNLAVQLLNKIIAKGLEPRVVLELLFIQMGWIVALALPMAVLVATLMTFGSMSADNEILAVRASGRSIYALLLPVVLAASILALLLVHFNNLVLPEANHRAANLTSDITRKKPEAFIEPRVLIKDFTNYVLWVDRVNAKSGMMRQVRIFSDVPGQNPTTTLADSGRVTVTPDGEHLQLTLYSGESHSHSRENPEEHFVARFERQVLFIRNVDSELRRTERTYRSDREKSAQEMLKDVKEFTVARDQRQSEYAALLDTTIAKVTRLAALADSLPADSTRPFDTLTTLEQFATACGVQQRYTASRIQSLSGRVSRVQQQLEIQQRKIAQYLAEIHKKYSIPVTTLVFVLIGAPLGIMARRGGLAMGTSYSIVFFVIFWVFLLGGESLADRLVVPPGPAMWSGNVIVGLVGLYLVLRMGREATFLSFEPVVRLWKRITGGTGEPLNRRPGILHRLTRPIADVLFYVVRRSFGILPVYLIRKFLGYFAGVLVAMLTVFIVVDYVSSLRKFEGAPLSNVALYYWYYLPWIALMVMPIIVLLASMGAMGSMAKNSELTAMKSSGISIRQLTVPLLFLGAALAVASFYVGEMVLPEANAKRKQLNESITDNRIERTTGAARLNREYRRDFYYFGGPSTLYRFEEFRTHPNMTRNVWRQQFDSNQVTSRITAASLAYRDSTWYFIDARVRTFAGDTARIAGYDTLRDSVLDVSPDEMVVQLKKPEEMSYWELQDFIAKVRRQGEKVWMYTADLYFKIALPAMNLIVLIIGIAITARAGRKGTAVLFGVGLLITFAYWIIAQFGLAFAHTGQLSPLAGAWLGNALFLVLGALLYRRALQ